jgi:hypothetical protein
MLVVDVLDLALAVHAGLALALEVGLYQPEGPLLVQRAHEVGLDPHSDHDLGERLAMFEPLEHLRGDLAR